LIYIKIAFPADAIISGQTAVSREMPFGFRPWR
jgi:hypothetical protein